MSPPPALIFANDTEKLQYINRVRNGPVGLQIKQVLEILCQTMQSFTAEEINDACCVDVKGNNAVFEGLVKNPKVNYDGRLFSYSKKEQSERSYRKKLRESVAISKICKKKGSMSPPTKIEKIQHIIDTRESPVEVQIELVLDLLYETGQSLTAEQINEGSYVHLKHNKAVFESLIKNPKVNYDGQRFSYKYEHKVRDQKEVLREACAEDAAGADLKDAYPTGLQVVDDESKELFPSTEMPCIERGLQKYEMKPATNTAKRKAEILMADCWYVKKNVLNLSVQTGF